MESWPATGTDPALKAVYHRLADGRWEEKERAIAQEFPLTVFVNGQEYVTLLCTPQKLNYLILGRLYLEGLIQGVGDVANISVCSDEPVAQVRLLDQSVALPMPRVIFSGCGSAPAPVGKANTLRPLESSLMVTAEELVSLMDELLKSAYLHRSYGGLHISGMADSQQILVVAEDIGRHNTLDKIQGECLYRGLSTKDRIILTTGRLSSEMVEKAARMGTPVVASRNSPTDRAVALAGSLGITLVGYIRGPHMSVYTHAERILGPGPG